MRPQIVTILTFIVGLFGTFSASAQLTSGGTPPPPPPTRTPPPELPLDSAILLLLIAGVIYGVYFTMKKVKNSNSPA